MKKLFCSPAFLIVAVCYSLLLFIQTGCANIVPPGGGPKDTLPPVLINAVPADSALGRFPNRIVLTFDEYVEVQDAFKNVLVSPTPNNAPLVEYKLRTITVKLRDTLQPNTTYSINFGNSIRDINEGNVFTDFTYVFSTGLYLDSNMLAGRVVLAETGGVDSTLIAVLHPTLDDSAVAKERPRYIARLDGAGNFLFTNLPSGTYNLFAIPNDFTKRYTDSTQLFAFLSQPVVLDSNYGNLVLRAWSKQKPAAAPANTANRANRNTKKESELQLSTNLQGNSLDLLSNLELRLSSKLQSYDTTAVLLTNKDFAPLAGMRLLPDTSGTTLTVHYPWKPATTYQLIVGANAFTDTAGLQLKASDTLQIVTRKEQDYGSLKIRFSNLDMDGKPVLQLVQNQKIVLTSPITAADWSRALVAPGEYELRILYDTNGNGIWDTGNYFGEKQQPETVINPNIKVAVRANWDNEKEIRL